jgi:hypothetical protein
VKQIVPVEIYIQLSGVYVHVCAVEALAVEGVDEGPL